jgi:CHASE3 domain sensor protein
MSTTRHRRTLTRQLTIAGVIFGVLEVVVFALLIGAVRSAGDANRRTNDVLAAVQTVSNLEKSVVDAETGMRGYVITGREQFLEATDAARAAIPATKRRIREQVRDGGERALLDPLFGSIDAYMTQWVDRAIAARRQSASRAGSLIETSEGKRRVDAIRA